jgi:hypothetical protein
MREEDRNHRLRQSRDRLGGQTADYSDKEMNAALEVNIPNYASAIVTTDELVAAISSLAGLEVAARS